MAWLWMVLALALGQELPCEPDETLTHEDATWVRCGSEVWRVHADGADRIDVPSSGTPVGLFVQRDRVWVELAVAVPLSGEHVAPPVAMAAETVTAPQPPPSTTESRGVVQRLANGQPIIDLGARQGLDRGDVIEFYSEETHRLAGESVVRFVPIAWGVVKDLGQDFAEVHLGLNQSVPEGTRARPVERKATKRLIAPPRRGGYGFVDIATIALLSPTQNTGGGVELYGSVGYRFKAPVVLQLDLTPTSLLTQASSSYFDGNSSLVLMLSYDHPAFAVGFGGGIGIGQRFPAGPAGLFSQHLRIGAVDGLFLDMRSRIGNSGSRWLLDHYEAIIQVPVTAGALPAWFILRGGGGNSRTGGHGHTEMGATLRIRGDGGQGTLSVTPYLGFSTRTFNRSSTAIATQRQWVFYMGPSFGLAVAARF